MANTPRFLLIGLACLALTACGGGGGGDGGSSNQLPTASFTATPPLGQVPLDVAFDASASSDPDGSIASYSWNFGDNTSGSGVTAAHAYTTAGAFTVTLTVTDNRGARATTTRNVTVTSGPPPAGVRVSGRITFERVPFSTALGSGLDFTRTFEAPAREIEVELLQASSQAVLATTVTDTNGNYTFTTAPNADVIVRAKALTRHTGVSSRPASWDVRVRNNTNGNALYVLDSSAFDTGVADQTRNLKAATGWGGGFSGVYTGVRAAAPFAVLDTIYSAAQFVITQGDGGAQLPALDAYWNERNVPTDGDLTRGEIGTTAYYPVNSGGIAPGIYVLGAANNDTDEFDQHIIAHEFQHYLEDTLSRADTVGGEHSLNERLDLRVAFSEGYSNAFSAMVLDDPLYRDSFGTAQGTDFHFSVESTATSVPGWYNESSVHRIVWDLFDTVNDGADTLSIGYAPMHDVFMNELRDDVPLTSLFAFITALKQRPGVPAGQVDALVEAERVAGTNLGIVSTTMTPYAATETHSGVADSSSDLVLPVYAPIALGGSARLCTSSSVTSTTGSVIEGSYNKLGNRRFLRFSVPTARTIRITLNCPSTDADCTGAIVPDPDFVVWRARDVTYAETSTPRVEQLDYPAAAGDHVLEVYEWSHIDPDATDTERRGRTCMTVNITG
jgi:PKD repeat protein